MSRPLRGESLITIGRHFKLSNYSSVSSVVARVNEQLFKNRKLAKRIENIQGKLTKSQPKACPLVLSYIDPVWTGSLMVKEVPSFFSLSTVIMPLWL